MDLRDSSFLEGNDLFDDYGRGGGGGGGPSRAPEIEDLLHESDDNLAKAAKTFLETFEAARNSATKHAIAAELLEKVQQYSSAQPSATPPAVAIPDQAPALWLERADRKQTPADFIAREYAPWLGKGLTQVHIRRLDKSLYMALHKWLMHNDLPFDLPTQKQKNDRLLEAAGLPRNASDIDDQMRERLRLHELARVRILTPG